MSYQRTINSFDNALDGDDKMYDIRQKADGTWDLKHETAWSFTIPAVDPETGYCIVDLPEIPARVNTASSNTAPTISGYTLVSTLSEVSSSATNFYCNYRRGFLVFNSAKAGESLNLDCYFIGSKFSTADLNAIWAICSDVAQKNGNSSEQFSAADPTQDEHVVTKTYAESNFANINGSTTEDFSVLTIQDTNGNQVVGSRQTAVQTVTGTPSGTDSAIIEDLITAVNDLITKLSSSSGHGLLE